MRQQYHFRPSKNGFYAWDAHKLVDATKDMVAKPVPLKDIAEIDEPYWFTGVTSLTCRQIFEHAELINKADLSYPIILCSKGRVMDGWNASYR